ncbi:unnamed protein product [Urochloa humidicola]
MRMANLVNFSLDSKRENRELPSRASLLSDLVSKGVLSCASQEVRDLYNLLEHEFLPLDLALKVQPLLSKISKIGGKISSASSVPEVKLSQYISALEKLTTLRVLQQASQIFQSMKIDMLSRMIPFFDFAVVEKISVDAVKRNFVAIKVNHLSGAVHFGTVDIESDGLSEHLSVLADSLNKARHQIRPQVKRPSKLGESLISLAGVVENEHRRLLARKSIIEKRKEDLERQILEKEKEEETKRVSSLKKTEEEERIRLLNEQRQREKERIRREIEEKNKAEARKLLDDLTKKAGKKHVVAEGELTKEAIIQLALNEQLKERQEMEKKLQKLAKTMDYLERAKRQEEAPLIEQAFQKRLEEEKILHEQEQLREIELSKQHHAGDLQEKNRLSRMLEHKNAFQERIVQRREAEFGRLKKERDDRVIQLISSRKREREMVRKLMYYLNLEEQRIEREREEEEARKREEEERRKIEEAEKKAKLDAIAAKQRQREMELEEREKARKDQLLRGSEAARVPEVVPVVQPPHEPAPAAAAAAAAAAGPGKYVPKWKRGSDSSSSAGGSQRPADVRTREDDRWGSREDRPRPDIRPLRQDGPPARQDAPPAARQLRQDGPPARQDAPPAARPDGPAPSSDRWRGSRYSDSSSSSSSTWGRPRN